ncbi:MAG: DUF3305 domain-containing protein [Halofilum sp. (in: g-proteobacteria)]
MTSRTGRGRALDHWPVRVLMRRSEIDRGAWSYPRWELTGILPDPDPPPGRVSRVVHETDRTLDLEWIGLSIPLFRDAAESYWYNLVGREPSLFVICRAGTDIDLEPFLVTANYDEAGAHMEADDQVLATPLPQAFGPALEQFVMQHYRPEPPRKRQRTRWSDDESPTGE